MPPSHVVPDNRKQEELEARTQSINEEITEFARMCNVTNEVQDISSAELNADKNLLGGLQSIPEEDCVGNFSDDLTDIKELNRKKFEKKKEGRRNIREKKRQLLRQRLRERNARLSVHVATSSVVPHAGELSDDEDDDEPEFEMSSATLVRNEMAHAAAEAKAFDKDDDELSGLLSSVSDAKSLVDNIQQSDEIDEWLGHLENLVILGYHLGKAKSFMDFFMAVASYAKMYSKNKSIVMELYKIINEVTETCGTEDVDPQAWTGREIMDKWELFKTNTIFKKISYLISAAMSLTVCTTKSVQWSPFGLKLVSFEAAKEQLAAVDVIDALVKTFVWMSEVGWKCFETKSIAPILYSDIRIQEYNETCDWVLAKADSAIAGNVDDLGEFENKLNHVLKTTCVMKGAKCEGPTALWLQKRYSDLMAISEKLAAKRKNTDIRVQPFGISIYGTTSVGKTTLGKLTMHQALAAMGFVNDEGVVDDGRIITMDMFDKYQSTWTSDILGVFMDDIGNAKPEFSKDNPHTSVIIKFFNNVAAQAIKAELNAKGVVFIDFKVGVVTTNQKDLDARCYSNCPESILRRFYHVDCEVREEFRKTGSTMLNTRHPKIRNNNSMVMDIWNLKIEECIAFEVAPGKSSYRFETVKYLTDDGELVVCENMSLQAYLKAIIYLSSTHKADQDSLMIKSKNAVKSKFCSKCKQYPEYCSCVQTDDVEPHAGEVIASVARDVVTSAFTGYMSSWLKPIDFLNSILGFKPIRSMATKTLARELQAEMNNTATPLLFAITPEWLFQTAVFKRTVKAWHSTAALYDIQRYIRFSSCICFLLFLYGIVMKEVSYVLGSIFAAWSCTCVGYVLHRRRVVQMEERYLRKRDALPDYAKNVRDGKFPKSILFVATLAVGVRMVQLWNEKRIANPQSMTPEDIEKQPSWFGYMMEKIGWKATSQVNFALPEHIQATCKKNLWFGHFTKPDGSIAACNVICPEKGIVWFPYHILFPGSDMSKPPHEWVNVTCFRDENRKTSKVSFIAQLNHNAVHDKELDIVVAFVPVCPDISGNFMKHLPVSLPTGNSMCTLLARNEHIRLVPEKVAVKHGVYGHKYMPMYGGEYTTHTAREGTCMALLIPEGVNPVIMGFHIGGNEEKQYGVMMTVTRTKADQMREKLYSLPGLRPVANSTELPETQYGKPLLTTKDVHPNAQMIIERDENSIIDVYGSTSLRSEAKSRVVQSILSPKIEEHFQVVNCWGAPRLKPNWKAFNATLQYIVNPSKMFMPSLLERARQDWLKPILIFAQEMNSKEGIAPLNSKEMVLGVAGKRFLDAMPMNTGMGFPIFGPKTNWFSEIREGERLVDRVPDPQVVKEMERMFDCWKRGERAYPVTTATLKDEPTPVDKEKVRVFQASAVAFGLWIRKYFLPIARIFSLCPLLSEMAVGVNAFGPQWDELMSHAEKFAPDRKILALDYSKYDVRMGGDMTYKVLQCFIDVAQVCNYTPEDIFIMSMMVVDMIHPLIDYNGTMIMAYNINTSGNNITVYINSIAGALYLRMGFFHYCPEKDNFRDWVAAMTYGDDETGSVREEVRNRFNFLTYKHFLAQHGMKITLPDKSENECEFLNIEDADFLKRQSNFIPEIGTRIGKLTEQSIFKSLHCNLKSKTETPVTVAISCVETALHEWFAHGREVYEDRRAKMQQVCEDLDLPIPAVHYSFDSRVQMWKDKYGTSDLDENNQL